MKKLKILAVCLILAGIAGCILTFLYGQIETPGNFGTESDTDAEFQSRILFYYTNSLTLLLAGILFRRRKKLGLYLFYLSLVFFVASIFVPYDMFVGSVNEQHRFFFDSLFVQTTGNSIVAMALMPFGTLCTLLFWFGIVFNLFNLRTWHRYFNGNSIPTPVPIRPQNL